MREVTASRIRQLVLLGAPLDIPMTYATVGRAGRTLEVHAGPDCPRSGGTPTVWDPRDGRWPADARLESCCADLPAGDALRFGFALIVRDLLTVLDIATEIEAVLTRRFVSRRARARSARLLLDAQHLAWIPDVQGPNADPVSVWAADQLGVVTVRLEVLRRRCLKRFAPGAHPPTHLWLGVLHPMLAEPADRARLVPSGQASKLIGELERQPLATLRMGGLGGAMMLYAGHKDDAGGAALGPLEPGDDACVFQVWAELIHAGLQEKDALLSARTIIA